MPNLMLLATAWGPRFGGINAFNTDFAAGLAGYLGGKGKVFCAAFSPTTEDMADARSKNVALVPIDRPVESHAYDKSWALDVWRKFRVDFPSEHIDWWVGHDVTTGWAAVEGPAVADHGYCALIMHMNYADYQAYKGGVGQRAVDMERKQKQLFPKADRLFANGPLLRDALKNITRGHVTMLIPGFPDVPVRPSLHRLNVITFGRMDRESDRIKQGALAVAGFGSAVRQAWSMAGSPAILKRNPQMRVIGISEPDADEEHALSQLVSVRAGRQVNLIALPYDSNRQQMLEEVGGANISLMLSWHEGFGLTGWEAIAGEVPLIISGQTGLVQLLQETFEGENFIKGYVRLIDVRGRQGGDDSDNFLPEDETDVRDAIIDCAAGMERAREAAAKLKRDLQHKLICTWENTARQFCDELMSLGQDGGTSVEPPPDRLILPQTNGSPRIFISYARGDHDTVAPLVVFLEAQGWKVWWDTRLRGGERWDQVIEREIAAANCVLVVWSPASVSSRWVNTEAHFALSRNILLPIVIGGAKPPFAFSLIQFIDFSQWTGAADELTTQLLDQVRAKLAETAATVAPAAPLPSPVTKAAQGLVQSDHAAQDWAQIKESDDPQAFRKFRDQHPTGILARLATDRLANLADAEWKVIRDSQQRVRIERFLTVHFDSEHVESARAMLAGFETPEAEALVAVKTRLPTGKDGDVTFKLATPKDLHPVSVVAQCLDNQWAPRHLQERQRGEGLSFDQINAEREPAVRRGFIRALLSARQVIINRAFLYNNHVVAASYEAPQDRRIFEQLLSDGSIVPFLFSEESPVGATSINDVVTEAATRWRSVAAASDLTCLRLDWDKTDNTTKIRSQLAKRFHDFAQTAYGADPYVMCSDLGLEPTDGNAAGLKARLGDLARFALHIGLERNSLVTREDLYRKFVTPESIPTVRGVIDRTKPFARELKELIDLKYNLNLPDALDRYSLTPFDSLGRSALQETSEMMRRTEGVDMRKLMYLFGNIRFEQALKSEATNIPFELISLAMVAQARQSLAFQQYIQAAMRAVPDQSRPLDEQALFSDPDRVVAGISRTYLGVLDEVTKSQTARARPWFPKIELLVRFGATDLSFSLSKRSGDDRATLSIPVDIHAPAKGAVPLIVELCIVNGDQRMSSDQTFGVRVPVIRGKVEDVKEAWKFIRDAAGEAGRRQSYAVNEMSLRQFHNRHDRVAGIEQKDEDVG